MADKTVIVEIKYDKDQAQKDLNDFTSQSNKKVGELTDEVFELTEANKKLAKQIKDVKGVSDQDLAIKKKLNQELQINKDRIKSANRERTETIKKITGEKSAFDKLNESVNKGNELQKKNTEALQAMPGPIGGVINGIKGIIKFSKAFIATPIGAVLAAIVATLTILKTTFTRNQESADKFQQKVAFLKGAFEGFKDVIADFGKNLIIRFRLLGIRAEILKARFQGNKEEVIKLKQEIEDLKNGLIDLDFDGIRRAAKGFEDLTKREQELEEADIRLIKTRAEVNKEIAKARLIAKDEKKSASERLKALELVSKLEIQTNKEERRIAKERVDIQKDYNALTKTTRDDRQKLAELEANLANTETASLQTRKRLETELNSLRREILTDRRSQSEEIIQIEARTYEASTELAQSYSVLQGEQILKNIERKKEESKELLNISNQYLDESLGLFAANYDERVAVAQRFTNSILELQQKRLQGEKITLQDTANIAKGITNDVFGYKKTALDAELAAVQENYGNQIAAFEEGSEIRKILERKQAEKIYEIKLKEFKLNKAESLLLAGINTAVAVTKMLGVAPPPVNFIAAGAVGILGGIQAALIATKKPPVKPNFDKGGTIVEGASHSQGGIDVWGSNGQYFGNVQGKEAMFVMNKDATAEIAAYDQIQRRNNGRESGFLNKSGSFQDGGQMSPSDIDIEGAIERGMSKVTIVAKVGDIETGLTELQNVKNSSMV